MTPEEAIQPWITAQHRRGAGLPPLGPGYRDLSVCFADPEVLAYARAEIERLSARGGNRTLAEHDHESEIRCRALAALVASYEAIPV